jgi:hypothetical protein
MENKNYITTKVVKARKHEENIVFNELNYNLNLFFVTFKISLFFVGEVIDKRI